MAEIVIARDDPAREDVCALLAQHHAFTQVNSPPGQCYAFNAEELAGPKIVFWTARRKGEPVGCVALCLRDDSFGELKSLHVLVSERSSGLGAKLVAQVLKAARGAGLTQLGLETGRSDGFAASRRLYERCGFVQGPAFPPYKDGTFSYCMTRSL